MGWQKKIQIKIFQDTEHGEFHDAMYFEEDGFDKLTEKDVDALVQERVDKWVSVMASSKDNIVTEPSKDALLEMKQAWLEQINQADEKIASIDAKV